jgi:hypothetical protein
LAAGWRVEGHLDVVLEEVAQAGRQQPDHPVEDDFQHRQAFVLNDARIDDGADAAGPGGRELAQREAEDAVDLVLVQDAVVAGELGEIVGLPVLDHRRPFGGDVAGMGGGALLGEGRAPLVGERGFAPLAVLGDECGGPVVLVDLVFRSGHQTLVTCEFSKHSGMGRQPIGSPRP